MDHPQVAELDSLSIVKKSFRHTNKKDVVLVLTKILRQGLWSVFLDVQRHFAKYTRSRFLFQLVNV